MPVYSTGPRMAVAVRPSHETLESGVTADQRGPARRGGRHREPEGRGHSVTPARDSCGVGFSVRPGPKYTRNPCLSLACLRGGRPGYRRGETGMRVSSIYLQPNTLGDPEGWAGMTETRFEIRCSACLFVRFQVFGRAVHQLGRATLRLGLASAAPRKGCWQRLANGAASSGTV